MHYKRWLIMLLCAVNMVLLASMMALSYKLPSALAQRGAGAGKYVAVTATYTAGTDALYILDTSRGQMVALTPSQQSRSLGQLTIADSRDVKADMGIPGN